MSVKRTLFAIVAVSAVVAIFSGLGRLGLATPVLGARPLEHGPLLVVGVFGTLIALERAVALGHALAYVAPLFGASTAVALLSGVSRSAPALAVAAACGLLVINVALVHRQPSVFVGVMLLGSVTFVIGNTAWLLGRQVFEVVPNWLAFFVLTIMAERLELARLGAPPRSATMALAVTAVLLATASTATLLVPGPAVRALGVALSLLGCWGLRFDLARRTIRLQGLPRFVAAAVLRGFVWLIVAGVLAYSLGLPPAGVVYDAVLHAVFVGFVLSMVIAHAPIILPAVMSARVPFDRAYYVSLAALHVGLIARVLGDLGENATLRALGAVVNALAVAGFIVTVLWARHRLASHRAAAPLAASGARSTP